MAITPALQSYIDRRKKNQPRNVSGQDPDYYPPSYSNVAEEITPETPQGEYQPFTGSRANRGTFDTPDGLAELDDASLERESIHGKQTKLKNDRKYQKHLDLLKSQGTTPVLDMDMGKVKRAEGDITVSDAVNPLSGTQFDQYAGTQKKEEEEEDDWWSNIQARLSEIGDWFGAGSSNTGMLGGQDRNVRLSNKWKSGQVPRAKGR